MSDSSHAHEFRGFAEVHSECYQASASWFGCGCIVTPKNIAIHVQGYSHIHLKADLLELRWFWFPVPTLVAVSRIGGQHCYSAFECLRWSRLRGALESCGYTFSEESRFCSFRRLRDDVRKYGLLKGTAP
jgi:hypothetical protein